MEEHQVGDLVFVLLPLFIQVAHGHIDRVIVQYDVAYYNNYQWRRRDNGASEIRRTQENVSRSYRR
jgi:hypothetical protein